VIGEVEDDGIFGQAVGVEIREQLAGLRIQLADVVVVARPVPAKDLVIRMVGRD
jgi:hypothetical protein